MIVELDDEKLQYSGRIDDSDPKRPVFIFPASCLAFRFFGTGAKATVENRKDCMEHYIGIIVDGLQSKRKLFPDGQQELVLAENLEEAEHEILLFKRQDSCHELVLHKLELSGNAALLSMPPKPKRKIEVYGDSVSAGEVSEAVEYVGKTDPVHNGEYSNSWYSYSWMAARKLNAQLHLVAHGGIPLLDGTGWYCPPRYLGMETVWDKLHDNPNIAQLTAWDFSKYRPHVVIAAIGQNDSNPEDYMKTDMEGKKAQRWRTAYKEWLLKIRSVYPKALIILTTTVLEHDDNWDASIERVCRELEDEKIVHFLYSRNGRGTPGHARIPEAEQMAEELSTFIEQMPESIWEDEA